MAAKYITSTPDPVVEDREDTENWLIQENQNLNDKVQDLEAEVTRLMYNGIMLNGEM
jgi:hypothetical protein